VKKCKECGIGVSTSAKVCPHCGKKYPTGGLTWPAKIFLILILLVAIGEFVGNCNQSPESVNNSVEVQSKPHESPKSPEKIYKEGDTVSVGYTSYSVWRSWWSKRLNNNQYLDNRPDAMFLFVV
jgi:hypothetical protein